MPLELRPITRDDTLSWTRIRSLAYFGPTHELLHTGPISESSIRGAAEDRKREVGKPNSWQWKIVDTDLEPADDDAEGNGGRTIAFAIWSLCNVALGESHVDGKQTVEQTQFVPPELRLDALAALLGPLRAAQKEIMGEEKPYFMLNSLATHPEHQRRGCAKLLLDWGLRKADEEGLRTYLDTSNAGVKIYEGRGFKLVGEARFDRRDWGGEGIDWHGCMVRELRTK